MTTNQRKVQRIAATLRRTIDTLMKHPSHQDGFDALGNLPRIIEAAYLIGYRDGSPTGLPLVIADHVIAGGSVLELLGIKSTTTIPESQADKEYRNA